MGYGWRNSRRALHLLRFRLKGKFRVALSRIRKEDRLCFLLPLLLYVINRFILKRIIGDSLIGYILRCHFNDYLGGICIIAYINIVLSCGVYSKYRITRLIPAIMIGILCGILWEYGFPLLFPRGTSDFWDVIAYTLGASTNILVLQRIWSRRKAN